MTKKKKWLLGTGGGILLLLAWIVVLSPWVWPGPGIDSLIISKETTWLTNPPMKPNGLVNYVKYIVDQSTEGVTPENNAMACFVRAVGPEYFELLLSDGSLSPEQLEQRIGMGPGEWKGPFLDSMWDVLKECVPVANPHEDEEMGAAAVQERLMSAPWTAAEYPKVKQWLDENATPLEWIIKGSQRERCSYWALFHTRDMNNEHAINVLMPASNYLREVGRVLAIRAMYKLGAGDVAGAWSDTMVIRRIARLVSQESDLISQLVGKAIDECALDSQQAILRSKTLTASQAKGMLKELQSLPKLPLLVKTMEMELCMILDMAMILVSSRDTGEYGDDVLGLDIGFTRGSDLDLNQMLRTFNTAWRPMIDYAALPTMPQRKSAALANSQRAKKELLQDLTTGDVIKCLLGGPSTRRRVLTEVISELLISIMYPSLERAQTLRDTAVTKSLLTETMAALAVYRAEKGQWPAALGDLVPGILPAIPADPWSEENAPLIYKRTPDGFLLYSLGYNETDDGGEFNDEIEEGDVLVSDPKREEDDEESDR